MPSIDGKYYTEEEIRLIKNRLSDKEFDEFLISGIVGAVTDSTVLGTLVGGSLLGGALGSLLGDGDIFD